MTEVPAEQEPSATTTDVGLPAPEVEQIIQVVMARIEQKIENHLHVPIMMPSTAELAEMRERTPEAYQAFLRMTEDRAKADVYMDRAEYDHPFRLASRGQGFGVLALLAILAFCAYVASLGTAGQIVGGILATFDLVAIISQLMAMKQREQQPPT